MGLSTARTRGRWWDSPLPAAPWTRSWWVLTLGKTPPDCTSFAYTPGRTARRGPTLLVDREHQGLSLGCSCTNHGGLDQVLGQVAPEEERPCKAATRAAALRMPARTRPPGAAAGSSSPHLQGTSGSHSLKTKSGYQC